MTVIDSSAGLGSSSLTAAASRSDAGGSEFNTFLKLLTTQMQNQDPLDPIKSSEYTQQLAQYSQLEQTIQGNGTLNSILTRLSSHDTAQAIGLSGRNVVLNTATAGLGAAPATWTYAADRNAASLLASITDASGRVVATAALPTDSRSGNFGWNGALPGGSSAVSGSYTLSVRGVDASGAVVPVAVNATGKVGDVTITNGVVGVDINGVTQPFSSIIRVSAPVAN